MFEKMSIEQYCEKLASEAPTPGGGSALAIVAATACSLIAMSAAITVAKLPETDEQYGYLIAELNSCNRAQKCFY
ncbi:MAG: cyclodeaminase/cyclohydrolase family protein, partial [Firmicutes bacterium]|nr:cyclodeaminase/cyclohydrolase family protein [Bacillota bacterium]